MTHPNPPQPHPCPTADLWILAGQSNMQGFAPLREPIEAHPRLWSFGADYRWTPAVPPLHHLFSAHDPVHARIFESFGMKPEMLAQLRRRGHRATPRTAGPGDFFGRTLLQHLREGVRIALAPCAQGGTTMAQWDPLATGAPGETMYGAMLRRVRATGLTPRGVLWYQGESDAVPGVAERYGELFAAWVARLRADLGQPALPILTVQIGRVTQDFRAEPWRQVREAQRAAAERLAHVELTTAIDLELTDWAHLALSAQQVLGRRLAHLALSHVYAREGFGRTIRLKSAEWLPGARPRIRLRWRGVTGALMTPGGARPAGFSVRFEPKADPPVDVWSVQLNGDGPGTAVLHLPQVPAERRVFVRYGAGLNPYCNVADEAGMALPLIDEIALPPLPA